MEDFANTPINTSSRKGFNKRVLVALGVVAILIGIALTYFFALRTSNSDYDSTSNIVTGLKNYSSKISGFFGVKNPILISSSDTDSILENIESYNASYKALSDSSILQHDSVIKTEFDKDKKIIETYGVTVMTTFESVSKYHASEVSCAYISQPGSFVPENAPSDCEKSLTELETSGTTGGFLETYSKALKKVKAAVDKNAPDTIIKTLRSDVDKIVATQKDTYFVLPASPVATYDSLTNAINSRKNIFFR